jgi:hypothetical protein
MLTRKLVGERSDYNHPEAACCKHNSETLGPKRGKTFIDELNDCELLKNYYVTMHLAVLFNRVQIRKLRSLAIAFVRSWLLNDIGPIEVT